VLFVVIASIFHGLFTPWLAPRFPKFFKQSYEPLFFNASLGRQLAALFDSAGFIPP
jgi:hypothetical protein